MSQQHHKLIWDSTVPSNVPSGSLAIAYFLGRYEWSPGDISRMTAVYRLCEVGGQDWFRVMEYCRGVGVEPSAASVQDAIMACHARAQHGHDDFTVYTSLDTGTDPNYQPGMGGIIGALRSHAPGLPFRVHVADADGNPNNRPVVDGVEAWAKQYLLNVAGGAYDLSVLFGEDDLVRS